MKRRDYLKTVGSTAILPIIANQTKDVQPPDIENIQWLHSMGDRRQLLKVETTQSVDRIELRRYAYGETSSEPTHERVGEYTHKLFWDKPTTVNDLHSILLYRNGQQIHEVVLSLEVDLLARHIGVDLPHAGGVAIHQRGDAALALLNRVVVTAPNNQPDYDSITFRNNRNYVALLEESTSYIPAYVTDDAVDAMRGHQTVWVWTKTENGALYPATVDFREFNPIDVYDLHGVNAY